MARVRIDVEADASGARRELSGLGSMFGGIAKGAAGLAAAGAAAVGAVAGFSLVKGFQRLTAIDQATAKLKGLGASAEEVKGIMDNALTAVKGTAFGLDEAASQAANFVAAGIAPGKQLSDTLALVADTATIAGTSMADVGDIFQDVAAGGKVTGETLNRLQERGIPAVQMLAKELGKTPEEIQKMVSKGQIGFDQFSAAMQKGLGGAAQEAGQTFAGAMANVQASLGRLGAAVLGPVFASLAPLMQSLIPIFDSLGKLAGQLGTQLMQAFVPLANALGPVIQILGTALLSALNAVMPAFAQLSAVIMPLLPVLANLAGQVLGALATVLGAVLTAITPVIQALVMFVSQIIGALLPYLPQIVETLGMVAGAFGEVLVALLPLLPALIQILTATLPLIPALLQIVQVAAQLVAALAPVIAIAAQLVASFVGLLMPALVGVTTMFTQMVGTVTSLMSGFIGAVTGPIRTIASNVISAIQGMTGQMVAGVQGGVSGVVGVFANMGGQILSAIGGFASSMFSAGARIVSSLADGIRSAIGQATSALSGGLASLRDIPPFSPAKTGPFSGRGYPLYSGMAISQALADGITRRSGAVTAAMRGLLGDAGTAGFGVAVSGAPGGSRGAVQNTFHIEVNVERGVAPAEVGRQIVDSIRAFERAAGAGWRAA